MEIECIFVEYVIAGYTCRVTKASITKPDVAIVSFKGIQRAGKINDDVTGIIFSNALVEYFPRNLQKISPRLKSLTILSCGMKEISREDLIGLEKLEWLDLMYNQLTSLPDDLFSNMPNLKAVWLSFNKIKFASSKLIEPIVGNQLELFSLAYNTSINEYYRPEGDNGRCKTIQELMAKIDEKCKPPATRMIGKAAQTKPPAAQTRPQAISKSTQSGSNCCNTAEIFKGFNEHRQQGQFTDFVIVVGSKEFPVHKSILALQSPVLAEMFEVKTNGRLASKLEITEMSAEAVEAFLDYLYERKQPDARNAIETFKLAAKYEVAKLRTICEQITHENLDESNAFEIFKLACGQHKSEKLKVAAFGKLQEKFGGELDDDLINNPEKLRKIVEAKKVLDDSKKILDDLMNISGAKRQRLV